MINQCTCENGTPVDDGIDCSSHGNNECKACTGNFHLSSTESGEGTGSNCEANVCVCSNGTPVADSSCTSHGGNECQECINVAVLELVDPNDTMNVKFCRTFTKIKTVRSSYSLLPGEYYASLAWIQNNLSKARSQTGTWGIINFKKYATKVKDNSEVSWNPTYRLVGSGYGHGYHAVETWAGGTDRLVIYS